ncbi:precorrin-2 dehydrogenase/sirohydrochlorin ferrochelatase family protein [Paenibacillus pini]|uniref:precorrin-2 dehydrogenase n=1 Tax=Paenibacillus pini JCM 16418 TaxID=1236976 RepID=W7YZD1_9BACL|nr:siroheme synthase [Paenibacillus pini JCM 16418]
MADYLPVMLNCEDRLCIVIGGGNVAERKVHSLLKSSACVRVISPKLTEGLEELHHEAQIEWIQRDYSHGDLYGGFLAYAATDRQVVNEAICHEAHSQGILVNVVNDSDAGNFISPSVLRRGRLTLTVSTSGAGPLVAAEICSRLEDEFGEEYELYLEFLWRIRKTIKEQVTQPDIRQRLLKRLQRLDVLDQLRNGTFQEWDTERIHSWIANNQEE